MDEILRIAHSKDTTDKEKIERIQQHLKENLLSSKDVAEHLNISHQTFYNRVKSGILEPFIRTGKTSGGNLFYLPDVLERADDLNIQKSKVNHRYHDKK